MPGSDDLDLLTHAAREAGKVALRYSGPSLQVEDKPDGAGPVTEADHAVNQRLHDILRPARPDHGWLSEETEDSPDRLARQALFIIDPIDGTRSFISGSGTWAISVALVRNGRPTSAVVYLPARDMLYAAALGRGATLNGSRLCASTATDIDTATVLATKPTGDPKHWIGPPPVLKRAYRPSLAYRLALVAQGRFDAMLTLRPSWEWDIAAGALITTEAGARTTDHHGTALRFNNPHPQVDGVLTGSPPLHSALLARLA